MSGMINKITVVTKMDSLINPTRPLRSDKKPIVSKTKIKPTVSTDIDNVAYVIGMSKDSLKTGKMAWMLYIFAKMNNDVIPRLITIFQNAASFVLYCTFVNMNT